MTTTLPDRKREKYELYIVSLWLLFLLIIVITVDVPLCFQGGCRFIGTRTLAGRNIAPLIALVFVGLGALYCFRFNYKIQGSGSIPVSVSSVEDVNYEHLTFLTTYIIPLICFNLTSVRYLVALAFLLAVIGVIYVKTDRFYANPTLALLGFRLYSASVTRRTGEEVRVTVVTRDHLQNGDRISFLELDQRVYFAKRAK